MSSIEKKLEEMGLALPEAPNPIASYVSAQRAGKLLFLSGSGPIENGSAVIAGKVGAEVTLEQGYEAARMAALNLIAVLKRELGDLDRVRQIVKLLGFVASAPDFYAQPAVINGASDLLVQAFGEKGRHARSAVAVPALPLNMAVEVELVVEVET